MKQIHIMPGGLAYVTFEKFDKLGIKHGFSTKLGGVSEGIFESMNLSFKRGDDSHHVLENHKLFAAALGYDIKNLVFSDQVHSTNILYVDESQRGKGIIRENDNLEVDGLITDKKDVVLLTMYADCVPLFFADQERGVVAMAHSGWKGTVNRIGKCMIEKMVKEFGCKLENIYVGIGPSICQTCYEVSEDVASAFMEAFDEKWYKEILENKPNHKYQLDLWRCNEIIMEEAGIPKENVETSGLCTCCHKETFFSHRATNGRRGNLAGIIYQ